MRPIKFTKHILFFLLSASLMACAGKETSSKQTDSYFSTSDFIKAEVKRLSAIDHTVVKTGSIGDSLTMDTLHVAAGDSSHWARELAVFLEADISKPAFKGKYEVDTLVAFHPVSYESRLVETYRSPNNKLSTREMKVIWGKSFVKELSISIISSNAIYQSEKRLLYIVDSVYSIEATQDVLGGQHETFYLENRFLPNVKQ